METAQADNASVSLTVGAVIITHAGTTSGGAELPSGWNSAVLVTVGFSLLGALIMFLARERPAYPSND